MIKTSGFTASYAAVQAAFWMDLCVALSFASVYLLGLGYSNSALGLILAAGNLLAVLLGPGLSSVIDRREDITAAGVMPYVLAVRFGLLVILVVFPVKGFVTTGAFALYIAFSMSVNSLNLKLFVDAGYNGISINYGVARGMGSLAYVLISFVLGFLISNTSIMAVPISAMAIGVFQLAAFLIFKGKTVRAGGFSKADVAAAQAAAEEPGSSMADFIRENKAFSILLLGTVIVFFSHNTVCNFLINVVENAGGGTEEMGLLNGFMAAVEIPVMLTYSRFFGKKDPAAMLRFAFIMFTAKAAAIAAAGYFAMLMGAFVLQAPSFAIYTAAIVPYTERAVSHKDSAKAQSLAFSMTTFSSVLSGTVSGVLYDNASVTATLWVSAAVCAVGTLVCLAGLHGSRSKIM